MNYDNWETLDRVFLIVGRFHLGWRVSVNLKIILVSIGTLHTAISKNDNSMWFYLVVVPQNLEQLYHADVLCNAGLYMHTSNKANFLDPCNNSIISIHVPKSLFLSVNILKEILRDKAGNKCYHNFITMLLLQDLSVESFVNLDWKFSQYRLSGFFWVSVCCYWKVIKDLRF